LGSTIEGPAAAARRPCHLCSPSHDEFELLLLWAGKRGNSREGLTQGAQDTQTAFDSIGPNRVGNGEEIAARVTDF
jgi:hypothetical protein